MMVGAHGLQNSNSAFKFKASRVTAHGSSAQIPGLTDDSINFLWQQLGDVSEAEDYVSMDHVDMSTSKQDDRRRSNSYEDGKFEVIIPSTKNPGYTS